MSRIQLPVYFQTAKDNDGYAQSGVPFDGYTVSGSITTAPIFVGRIDTYCAVAYGSASGTVKLQGCSDPSKILEDYPDVSLANKGWFDLTFIKDSDGSRVVTQSVAGASSNPPTYQETDCGYRWVRAVYSGGSGTLSLVIQLKGNGG